MVLENGDGRSFPRRYASMRRCVADLAALEGEFHATIEGRNTETGERRSVSGRVVEVAGDEASRTARITVEIENGEVIVGGQVAALEAIEAHEIRVERQ